MKKTIFVNLKSAVFLFLKTAVCVTILLVTACAPSIDYHATYTAFWENLPTDTPSPTETPTDVPTVTPTQAPTNTATMSPSPTLTETLEPTASLTPTWSPNPYMIWPDAEFTQMDVWWGGDAWCPQRGENVSCETEYRQYANGCFVGMTCYDVCGKYYGVDTIKYGVGDYTFVSGCLQD